MTNFSKAIKLAIEGGYQNLANEKWQYFEEDGILFSEFADFRMTKEEILLDPIFWQCLGKKLGWGKVICRGCETELVEKESWGEKLLTQNCNCYENYEEVKTWLYHALRYFELVLTNGDTEKYWEELLK